MSKADKKGQQQMSSENNEDFQEFSDKGDLEKFINENSEGFVNGVAVGFDQADIELIAGCVLHGSMRAFHEWQEDVNNLELEIIHNDLAELVQKFIPLSNCLRDYIREGHEKVHQMSPEEIEAIRNEIKRSDFSTLNLGSDE